MLLVVPVLNQRARCQGNTFRQFIQRDRLTAFGAKPFVRGTVPGSCSSSKSSRAYRRPQSVSASTR